MFILLNDYLEVNNNAVPQECKIIQFIYCIYIKHR